MSSPADIVAVSPGRALLQSLREGRPIAALGVRSARTPAIARLAKASGHHLIWVDLEHSSMPIDSAAQICACAHDIGLVALVRVPEREYGVIGRLLDGGATGIIAPRIETVQQAGDVVAACRFPPLGHRSAIAQLPALGYRRMPAAKLYDVSNRQTLVKLLIESPLGVENLPRILELPGIDLIGIGANDLSAELGVPGDYRHPSMRDALDRALAACRAADIPLAIGGIPDAAHVAELTAQGAAPFLMTGIDTEMLLTSATERLQRAIPSLS